MADLKTIVDRMIAAGEPEEAIGGVIQEFNRTNRPKPAKPVAPPRAQEVLDEPDNFFEGFSKSIFGGEALNAGWEGAKGWAKGAVVDIPSTLFHGAKDALDMKLNPGMTSLRMSEGLREIPNIVSHAGSDPQPFGRMMGQLTGQPAILEGALMGAPRAL